MNKTMSNNCRQKSAAAMQSIPHEVILVDDVSENDTVKNIQRKPQTHELSLEKNCG